MRIDHIAYRVQDKDKTAKFFQDALGYKIQDDSPFEIKFNDGSTAQCVALEPPEKANAYVHNMSLPWQSWVSSADYDHEGNEISNMECEYHLAPEVFISDGPPGSIVGDWVKARGGIGGIHHIAFMVDSVENTMKEWQSKGYAEFTTDEPLTCPGITQVFTKPSELTGVIYEFIERGARGFCKDNVRDLMLSTKGI